jgi:hypothetical protein
MTRSASTRVFAKETLFKGQPAQLECVEIGSQTFTINRGLVTVVSLEDEWFHEVHDPAAVLDVLRADRAVGADVFSFCQRLPNTEPLFPYPHETESIAAARIQTYDEWWTKQIEGTTRNQIRKSLKVGVEVRQCAYDDEFVRGMTSVFNETPIRQGRRFWHFGKDFETVKRQFSRNLFREDLIGAYYKGELIGFAMVGRSDQFADLGQIISQIAHRDKSVTSALIAKAVELCCERRIPQLVYAFWTEDSLGHFKRRLGFREVKLPRYVVPLSVRGRLAVRAGLHSGWKTLLPDSVKDSLRHARSRWYQWRDRGVHG